MGKNFLYNSKKMNVTAIMGFTRALWQLIQQENPTHIAVVFDHKSANVRVQEFEYYKANRDATPEDIILSEPYIRQIIEAMKIPILEKEGYEADDVIGTIAKQKARENHLVYMVTPDKDFAQLVEENIKIYKPSRQGSQPEILGVEEIKANWEIEHPHQVIDILALWGDAVDNIPGIPGIGEKTSKELIKKYGSVENLITNAEELKGKQKENVINFAQQGLDSKKLATIITDVPIEVSDEALIIEPFDKEKLREIFTFLEFKTLQKDILGEVAPVVSNKSGQPDLFSQNYAEPAEDVEITTNFDSIKTVQKNYIRVDNETIFNELQEKLKKASHFAFDTETTDLHIERLEIVGISFSTVAHEGYYIPLKDNFGAQELILEALRPFFIDKTKTKIAQNLKFDLKVLEKYNIKIAAPFFDTMLAHYLLDADSKHGMDMLSKSYLNYAPISYDEMIGKGKSKISIEHVDPTLLTQYAAEDADITYQLYQTFEPKLKEVSRVNEVFETIELPLIPVLSDMEQKGVAIDIPFLKTYSEELAGEIKHFETSIFEQAGQSFNLDSPKQLGEILFTKMKIPSDEKKTKTGQFATGEEVLNKLKKDHQIVRDILEYREIAKLKSTYIDALPNLIHEKTGRIHTSFNQAIAATGRLSSTDPNLQNIPIRTERGRKIRQAFIAQNDEYQILSADYSQIELRLIASLSGDETMIEAFRQGQDIHSITASKVLGIPFEEVTKEQRSNAKVVNFGIIYGVSAFGLSQQSTLNMSESKEMIANYFRTYPKIKAYMDNNIALGRENGFVETIMGRRRYLKDINSRNQMMRGVYERIAINAPVQGSAADLIKMAMIQLQAEIKRRALKSFMTIQVHDELLFEVHQSEIEEMKDLVVNTMQNAMPNLAVPILAEYGIGKNWYEAH
jgi:DNA polymerase-1